MNTSPFGLSWRVRGRGQKAKAIILRTKLSLPKKHFHVEPKKKRKENSLLAARFLRFSLSFLFFTSLFFCTFECQVAGNEQRNVLRPRNFY